MATRLVQITGEHREFDGKVWTPWFNCKGTFQDTALLALRKFMREAGYTRSASGPAVEFDPFTVRVWVAAEDGPTHESGVPMFAHAFEIRLNPEDKRDDTISGQGRQAPPDGTQPGGQDPGPAPQS